MSQPQSVTLAVVMQRRIVRNRWQTEAWLPVEARLDDAGDTAPRMLPDDDGEQRWLHPGLRLVLPRDEC